MAIWQPGDIVLTVDNNVPGTDPAIAAWSPDGSTYRGLVALTPTITGLPPGHLCFANSLVYGRTTAGSPDTVKNMDGTAGNITLFRNYINTGGVDAVNSSGFVYIADFNGTDYLILKMNPDGTVHTTHTYDPSDANLYGGVGDAYTLKINPGEAIAYFAPLADTPTDSDTLIGINRFDLVNSVLLTPLDFDTSVSDAARLYHFTVGHDGKLWVLYQQAGATGDYWVFISEPDGTIVDKFFVLDGSTGAGSAVALNADSTVLLVNNFFTDVRAFDISGTHLFTIDHFVDASRNFAEGLLFIPAIVYQGLQRMNPDASIQWAKLDGF